MTEYTVAGCGWKRKIQLDESNLIEVASKALELEMDENPEWDVQEYIAVAVNDESIPNLVLTEAVLANIGLHRDATVLRKIINGDFDHGEIEDI